MESRNTEVLPGDPSEQSCVGENPLETPVGGVGAIPERSGHEVLPEAMSMDLGTWEKPKISVGAVARNNERRRKPT